MAGRGPGGGPGGRRVTSSLARSSLVVATAAGWVPARGSVLTGATVAATALVGAGLVAQDSVSAPSMALLVLLPLALGELASQLADAGTLEVSTRAADARLRPLERTAPAVRDTVSSDPPPGTDHRRGPARPGPVDRLVPRDAPRLDVARPG